LFAFDNSCLHRFMEISRLRDGIAKIEGFVVFVKNRKMGDKVKVKVSQVGNRFATARVV
jgi:predicted RNA-binding protein with TRAM domain